MVAKVLFVPLGRYDESPTTHNTAIGIFRPTPIPAFLPKQAGTSQGTHVIGRVCL